MNWELVIKREINGYILQGTGEEGNPETRVIEDSPQDNLKSHENLLWEIMNYFNFGGSKHDKERIRIKREKQ